MPDISLKDYQLDAVHKMSNGCILCGGVGSGKSRTALAYYYLLNGGDEKALTGGEYKKMQHPTDLLIITTAKKRDDLEWEREMLPFLIESELYPITVKVDSWNNIQKYSKLANAFVIFDEQRVVGSGPWVKAFYKITKNNKWILLSATPGDKWTDYIPVFVANGFFKSKTEFNRDHVIFKSYTTFPVIERYINEGRLIRLRNKILVDMDFDRQTVQHHITLWCNYDIAKYKDTMKNQWNPYKNEPIENGSELCLCLRKIVNSDDSRQAKVLECFESHRKLIIFYNYDYELEILKNIFYGPDVVVAEWNGHKHQEVPDSGSWVYLVQYTAGAEGWNCVKTDAIIFFSQNYSYRTMVQASGRIDRMNTRYTDLYYYHLKSRSSIDAAISKALGEKKKFNEKKFAGF